MRGLLIGMACSVSIIRVLPDSTTRRDKCDRDYAHADRAHGLLLQLLPEEEHERRAEGRKQRDYPDVVKK